MKQRLPSMLFTFSLMILLGFILVLLASFFISGPARLLEKEDRAIVHVVRSRYQLDDAELLARHSYHQVVYVLYSRSRERLYFVDIEGFLIESTEVPGIHETLRSLLNEYQLNEEDLTYGYALKPVFVLETLTHLIFVEFDGTVVLNYRKGIR